MVAWKRYAKRTKRRVATAAKKRYFRKGQVASKNLKLVQVAKDVSALKHLLNVEKKTYLIEERNPIVVGLTCDSTKTSTAIDGQAVYSRRDNVNYSGAYVNTNIIGTITQGVADGQIVGERAKMVSYHMDYRIRAVEGSNANSPSWGREKTKVHLYLVMMPRGDQVLTDGFTAQNQEETMLMRFFEPSVFDNTYDGTRRNIEFMKDFKVLSKRTLVFRHNENNDGNISTNDNTPIAEGKMGGKLDHHIRYNGPALIKNRLALIAISDAGTLVGSQGEVNHFTLEYSMKLYYVDN